MKLLTASLLLVLSFFANADSPVCETNMGETYVGWPTNDPVWEMCFLRPLDSSSIDGSSLEVRQVYFNGYLVFERAHMPILFAQYTSGLCYRDWKDDDSPFIRANQVENPTQAAITTCDASISDTQPVGSCPFGLAGYDGNDCMTGVQVEKYPDRMVLTTNHAASWYKYSSRFIFYADGRIQPRFGFGNSTGTQNNNTHWHHGYWRMNFDIDGADNDEVFIIDGNGETLQNVEFSDLRGILGHPANPYWMVKDSVTGRGYRVEPGTGGDSQTGGIDDYAVPTDASGSGNHEVDFMATKYKVLNGSVIEYSDTPFANSLGECEMFEENLVGDPFDNQNLPESLLAEDVVFWYRTAVNDIAPKGMLCKTGGPTLYPVGDWSSGAAPVAVQDTDTVLENSSDNMVDVMSNDTDVDGGSNFITATTQPSGGVATIDVGGSQILYTPNSDYCNDELPTDDFEYTLNGGSSAQVQISVTCVDSFPTAAADTAVVDKNVTNAFIDVLDNDTDPDGGPQTVETVVQPVNGVVVIGTDGAYVEYTPMVEYCNDGVPTDDFSYTLNGGSQATVEVTVTCLDPSDVIFADDFE